MKKFMMYRQILIIGLLGLMALSGAFGIDDWAGRIVLLFAALVCFALLARIYYLNFRK